MEDINKIGIEEAKKADELLKEKTLVGIQKVLSYRSKENKFSNSILQICDDPYITLFNFSYDTEKKNVIYLNSYTNDEVIELEYNL